MGSVSLVSTVMHVYRISNGKWVSSLSLSFLKSNNQKFKSLMEKKKWIVQMSRIFPIYQYPTRVFDVEADPSEEAAAAPFILRVPVRSDSAPFACRMSLALPGFLNFS